MKALDTNVLVRFLIKDDEEQTKIVYERFQQAELSKELLFVSNLVLLEMICFRCSLCSGKDRHFKRNWPFAFDADIRV